MNIAHEGDTSSLGCLAIVGRRGSGNRACHQAIRSFS